VIWEVFRQEREGQPFTHGGSLEAPNREFAEAYAVEFYGRRAESVALWVVPREAISDIEEPYVADVFDRDYRRVDGYSLKVKLKEARERVAAKSADALSAEEPGSPRIGKRKLT
jgi:ring-1,2-phenylacetyl-CoA epoxidase subunit PaaB